MTDASPSLEVGFAINPEGSMEALLQLERQMDTTEARVLADANRIERATGGMVKLGGATLSMTAFGNASSKAAQDIVRESARIEKAGEGIVRSLERENAAYGKTREELRLLRAEEAAASARRVGNVDLARRIEEQVAEMLGRQQFTARQAAIARENAAEDAAEAEIRHIRAVEAASKAAHDAQMARLRAKEQLDALLQRNFSVGRERATDIGATFSALEAREKAIEQAERQAAAERAVFQEQQQQIALLAERARLEAALERNTGVGRPRAIDQGATFSALAAKAAEDEARAQAAAAATTKRHADEHARLAELVRASQAAQEADAVAADKLRMATDPLYASTKRLNEELAESTRLYHAGATPPAEYARQQQVLQERLRGTARAHEEGARATRRSGFALQQLAMQAPDVVQGLLTGQKPMTVFIQQGAQILQVAQMAEGGLKGFARQVGLLALAFTPVLAATSVAGVAIWRWKEQLNDDAGLKKYAEGLGLTHKEMKKLGDVSVTTGDLMSGLGKTISDTLSLDGSGKKIMDALFSPNDAATIQAFVAQIYGVFVGGYNGIVELWGEIAPAISSFVSAAAAQAGAFFKPVIDAAKWAADAVMSFFSGIYEWVAGWAKRIGAAFGPLLVATGNSEAAGALSGIGSKLGSTFGAAYSKAAKQFVTGTNAFVGKVGENAVAASQARLSKKAAEIKADRTPKTDRHAEQLLRDAQAIEAQIRNLYALADAYRISGAAALIAEARVKAESQAIKQRGDIEAAVDRQIRLSIAQRVSDAAKSAASTRDQAIAQQEVNALVAAGLVPAERAAELVRDRIADLPLLAAIEVAQQRGLTEEVARATRALEDQRGARARLTEAETAARLDADLKTGSNRLAELREEQRLVGATDMARVRALATLKATQDAQTAGYKGDDAARYIQQQVDIAVATQELTDKQDAYNETLSATADWFATIDQSAQDAASGMASAFGDAGAAIGDALTSVTSYYAVQADLQQQHQAAIRRAGTDQARIDRENRTFALRSSSAQVGAFGDMAAAAKGFFKEGSDGYRAMATAEKVFRAVQFALSVKAVAQDAIETGTKIANSVARTAAGATEAVVNAIKSLPFPLNIAAGAATVAALASIGVSIAGAFGGSKNNQVPANNGTGTVLGDTAAKSESITRAIESLREVDTLTNSYAREMAGSLRSIDSQIGNVASLVVRSGDVNASTGVTEGFKTNAIGSVLKTLVPIFGGALSSLFGTKTSVTASGLYGRAQSLGSILAGGFDASTFSDVEKTKKFLGITTGKSRSTQYGAADAGLENQFTLILRQFNDAIAAAAGPLGAATSDVQNRLNSFVVDIGKIDLQGLTGEQIQEKLTAVFGAAADRMANAAFPGIDRFQKVGEGAFETLVRVASTVEAVTNSLDQLGVATRALGIDAKLGIAAQFDSVSDFTSAAQGYFEAFYSAEEQAAAKSAQLGRVFTSLGLSTPATLAAFRQLVEAQDLTTAAGQATYATLLQLAPAFAELQQSMAGAKSAADVLSERADLQRRILELNGDTAALRALELAKLDPSNRALQQQVYAIQDAQEAAKAAEQLRDAWTSVGDSIMDEVKRIRGLTGTDGAGGFATILGQFNAATSAARAGDQDAAKSLPGLSQSLLKAAADAATSRQELERVQAEAAASLEATYGAIAALMGKPAATATSNLAAAATAASSTSTPAAANDDLIGEVRALRAEVADLRRDNNAGHAATSSAAGRVARRLDDVTAASSGEAISVAGVAA